jgi:hypothetical protein
VRNGASVTREPDLSGQAPFAPSTPEAPPAVTPPSTTAGPEGGTQAPSPAGVASAGGGAPAP